MAERDIIIDPKEYPSNNKKTKFTNEHKVEKIVQGNVKKTKTSFIKRASSIFFSDVSEDDIKTELIFDYLIPTIKDTLVDMGKMLLDAIFYGSTTVHKHSSGTNKPVKVSYSSYYDSDKKPKRSEERKLSSYDFSQVVLNSRGDAEDVLDMMIDMIRDYKAVSVADFCDLVGVESNFTDNKYGWTDLTRVTVSRTRDGYIINFPKPVCLDLD